MNRKIMLTGLFCAAALVGCGDSEQSLSEKAGKVVGEGVTGFFSGVGVGVDEKMVVETELGEGATKAGLERTTSKASGMADSEKSFSVYLVAHKAFKGTLMAKAQNKDGQEVGRSKLDVDFKEGDADYQVFVFNAQMDSQLVHKYIIDTL